MKLNSLNRYISSLILIISFLPLYAEEQIDIWNKDKKKNSEINKSETRKKSTESYAKRYAAKEACSKALGTGLARGVFWKDIEIKNDIYGKPSIKLHNNALKYLNSLHIFRP